MSSFEAENVCKYLKSKDIQLSPNNPWLISCISWYKSHLELANIYGSLQVYTCIQWLMADLQDVQHSCLPTNYKDRTIELTGKYCVQINWMRDIGQSCYSQLQAVQKTNNAESNDNVSADEPNKQQWEPNPKRMLMMEITDGITTLKAMEYSPILKLAERFLPGLKVLLTGPIECRKGIMFLKNNNVSLLGGELEHLHEINSKENLLSKCLNLTTNNNVIQERNTNVAVTSTSHEQNIAQTNRSQLFDDIQELPDSTSITEHNPFGENREMLMSDDDDFLCQLPDEVLNDTNTVDPEPNQLSPVLDERTFISNTNVIPRVQLTENRTSIQRLPVLNNKPLGTNRPKLFPSLEDLRPVGTETSTNILNRLPLITPPKEFPSKAPVSQFIHHPSTSYNTNSNLSIPSTSSKLLNSPNIEISRTISEPFENSQSLNKSHSNNPFKKEGTVEYKLPKKDEIFPNDKSEVSVVNMIVDEEEYPQCKNVEIKVQSIEKLKIRNGEWFCSAIVLWKPQSISVTFSNKVLESLFGISAAEVEIWRADMAVNASLKKKVNDILKAGQTKLKLLNCPMTLEYSSEDCIPHVIAIHAL